MPVLLVERIVPECDSSAGTITGSDDIVDLVMDLDVNVDLAGLSRRRRLELDRRALTQPLRRLKSQA